jgi:hypothetical protein
MTEPAIRPGRRTTTSTRLYLFTFPWLLGCDSSNADAGGLPGEPDASAPAKPDGGKPPTTPPTGGASHSDDAGTGGKSATGGAGGMGGTGMGGAAGASTCVPTVDTEARCSDGKDDDCDGFTDCLDPDCDGKSCGDGGLTCQAGGCFTKSAGGLPELPRIENVVSRVRGDTLLVDFSAVDGAKDFRIYPLPDAKNVLVGTDGSLVVRDAVYRCAGDLARLRRDSSGFDVFGPSLKGNVHGYTRTEADSLLGYVFLTPAAGRKPVYRVGDPNRNAGYAWPAYVSPPGSEYTGGDYVVGTEARDKMLAKGFRDDGVAFYLPGNGTRTVHASEDDALLFYVDGPEATARGAGTDRFEILATEEAGSVPLYRVYYWMGAEYDLLAAGKANRERALYQGNVPITTLMWPGIRKETTFVVEALDGGCPFPGGFLGAEKSPSAFTSTTAPTITLDEAKNPMTGELFVNGQHEPGSHPKPIARAFVTAAPAPPPGMDWFMGFDQPLSPLTSVYEDGNGVRILHNDKLSVEFVAAPVDHSFGIVLDQFAMGSSASFSLTARNAGARIASADYLHVTMSADIASTGRRYPQIFITNAPADLDKYTNGAHTHTITARLGPYPFESAPPGPFQTILVQVFGATPELQVEFCDQRGWGVSQQCPRANIYGFHAGTESPSWTLPWLPVPIMGNYAGMDRPVKFDVYASTERVYVFVEDRPAGCAVLPAGRMPAGDVTVVFGAAGYHIEIDEHVEHEGGEHEYWHRYSVGHVERRFDDLGVRSKTSLPMPWDESVLPCGDRFYE